jgi:hypothetical protein
MPGRIDVDQINRNRRIMEDSTIDSPYIAPLEDSDADFPEMLFDRVPGDRVGHLPPNEKNRNKR